MKGQPRILNRLIELIPSEIGVNIEGHHTNVLAFVDDLILVAATPTGLQDMLNTIAGNLSKCGLDINLTKFFTISIRNQKIKTLILDGIGVLPALKRTDKWRNVGVLYTPEGRNVINTIKKLTSLLE